MKAFNLQGRICGFNQDPTQPQTNDFQIFPTLYTYNVQSYRVCYQRLRLTTSAASLFATLV